MITLQVQAPVKKRRHFSAVALSATPGLPERVRNAANLLIPAGALYLAFLFNLSAVLLS